MSGTPRLVEVRQRVLKENDLVARELRDGFGRAGVLAVSLVSSPGAGKTTLLQKTLLRLREHCRMAVLVGDLATDNDARRLASTGVRTQQITTGTVCHLEAEMIRSAIRDWNLRELDLLFIENVGNLVCPASFDLGESLRAVLLSVTEGEDKPLKYPPIFHTADVTVLTKLDLAEAAGFDRALAERNLAAVRPGMQVLGVSARTGQGMDEWIGLLTSQLHACRRPRTP